VGLALGFRVPKIGAFPAETWAGADRPDVYAELDKKVTPALGTSRNWRSSMGQDVTKRRRTEIEQMNGHVVAKGREAGVPTPVSEIVVDIVRGIDAGTREPAPATIDETLRRAGNPRVAREGDPRDGSDDEGVVHRSRFPRAPCSSYARLPCRPPAPARSSWPSGPPAPIAAS
jgi:hypothetical protein